MRAFALLLLLSAALPHAGCASHDRLAHDHDAHLAHAPGTHAHDAHAPDARALVERLREAAHAAAQADLDRVAPEPASSASSP